MIVNQNLVLPTAVMEVIGWGDGSRIRLGLADTSMCCMTCALGPGRAGVPFATPILQKIDMCVCTFTICLTSLGEM